MYRRRYVNPQEVESDILTAYSLSRRARSQGDYLFSALWRLEAQSLEQSLEYMNVR